MSSGHSAPGILRRQRRDAAASLEEYYESRVARLNEERDALLTSIARCANSREENHWLDWAEGTLAATEEGIDKETRGAQLRRA
eukprot:scaffold1925_cov113-Pinguiococcus_pyrenoidosus.AAC.1